MIFHTNVVINYSVLNWGKNSNVHILRRVNNELTALKQSPSITN